MIADLVAYLSAVSRYSTLRLWHLNLPDSCQACLCNLQKSTGAIEHMANPGRSVRLSSAPVSLADRSGVLAVNCM